MSQRELRERVELYRGQGKQAASKAILLVRQGAESRPETLLRLAIMDAGLPEPEVNPDIRNASGRFVGRGDLVYQRWRVIVEYDGEQHRLSTKQFDRDVQRLENLSTAQASLGRATEPSNHCQCTGGSRSVHLREVHRIPHPFTSALRTILP